MVNIMMPLAPMNHGAFKFVKIPKIKDMYLRIGGFIPENQESDDLESVLPPNKNDAVREVEEFADAVPVNEPEE